MPPTTSKYMIGGLLFLKKIFDVQKYTENVLQPITEDCLKKIDHFGNYVGTE